MEHRFTYKVELANGPRINLWGVSRFINGCRNDWVLVPQESETVALEMCAMLNREIK